METVNFKEEQQNVRQLSKTSSFTHDVEKNGDYSQLSNEAVKNFAWENITVTVKDRQTGNQKAILKDSFGAVQAGEMLAIMGPRYVFYTMKLSKLIIHPTNFESGCGKTTLLNVLAHRVVQASSVTKSILFNGKEILLSQFQQISSYVEQEDALLGALTVKETLAFAAKLSLPRYALFPNMDSFIANLSLDQFQKLSASPESMLYSLRLVYRSKLMFSLVPQFAKVYPAVKSVASQLPVSLSPAPRSYSWMSQPLVSILKLPLKLCLLSRILLSNST
jgi:ABC-type uncharacterized transport system YnjBCD ATPase subunit